MANEAVATACVPLEVNAKSEIMIDLLVAQLVSRDVLVEIALKAVRESTAVSEGFPKLTFSLARDNERRVRTGRGDVVRDFVLGDVRQQCLLRVAAARGEPSVTRCEEPMVCLTHRAGEERRHLVDVLDQVEPFPASGNEFSANGRINNGDGIEILGKSLAKSSFVLPQS